jgi:Domain of unknown function (DUF4386)
MTTQVVAGLLLMLLPVAYNLFFTLLARGFDYPDILRRPTGEVLERFAAGGSRLVLIWWGFAMCAVLFAPAVVLVSATLGDASPTVLALARVALIQSELLHPLFGVVGLVLAPLFVLGSLEFVGPFEPRGWKLAGTLVPVAYIGWSVWLLALGIGLLLTA